MKIAVIGIGAMGSFYAAKLSKHNDVIAFEHLDNKIEAVNRDGINLIEDGETNNYRFKVFKDGTYKEVVDVVLVLVKATQTQEALKANLDIIGENTIILTLQNGLGNVKDISKFVDPSNIVVGSSRVNVTNEDINTVKVSGNGLTYIGSVTNDMKDVLTLKVVFDKAGFECETTNDIKTLVWDKLIMNSVLNPLCAIFKCKIKVLYENKYIYDIVQALVEEDVCVAKANGIDLKEEDILNEIRALAYNIGNSYASMYYDVKNSRITEIDKLNGAIVLDAYKNKIQTPYNTFLLNAIKGMEKLY